MTSKRFIKLLMSKGFSRNEAQEFALDVQESRKTYAEAYSSYTALESLANSMPDISSLLQNIRDSLIQFAGALVKAVGAFVETFQNTLAEGNYERITTDDKTTPSIVCTPTDGDRAPNGEIAPFEE